VTYVIVYSAILI